MKTIREFVQTSSILRRLRLIILLVAVFLLAASAITWLSSRRYVHDVQHLNQLNRLTSLSTRAATNLISARENLEKLLLNSAGKGREHIPVFEASLAQASLALKAALEVSAGSEKKEALQEQFRDASESLAEFEKSAQKLIRLFPPADPAQHAELNKEMLLVRQFELEAMDALRKGRLEMAAMSEVLLETVFRNRFTPFLVSFSLSLFFFFTALALGLSVTRRLKSSLQNLLDITDQVAAGNLNVAIEVRRHDEIGRLTYAFDRMVSNLKQSMKEAASLYDEARRAIEIRDSFLSIAAHELKTPLTSLKLQVQLGEIQVASSDKKPLSAEKLNHIFRVCHSQADRLNALVDDLLDVGRIERGTIVYNFEPVDLRELVDGVLERFGEALRVKGFTVEADAPGPVMAHADPFRIEQVLINLLSNSAKYGLDKPIRIRLGREGAKVYLAVSDQGMGIEKEKQALIFDRFERAITSRNISGLGLGLYISRHIVEAHGGTITVDSEIGKGSTFRVELPAAKEPLTSQG